MPSEYTVKKGEHLPQIAHERGLDYRTIWDHPDNRELNSRRKTPSILLPGDRILIPDQECRTESCATGLRHRFKLIASTITLHVRLTRADGTPRANLECVLSVDGSVDTVTTDGDGVVKRSIASTAR